MSKKITEKWMKSVGKDGRVAWILDLPNDLHLIVQETYSTERASRALVNVQSLPYFSIRLSEHSLFDSGVRLSNIQYNRAADARAGARRLLKALSALADVAYPESKSAANARLATKPQVAVEAVTKSARKAAVARKR